MHLLLILGFVWTTAAAPAEAPQPVNSPKALAVKEKADSSSQTLFYTKRGEKVWKMGLDGDFTRVKIKRNKAWIAGYIDSEDLGALAEMQSNLENEVEPTPSEKKTPSQLGLGVGAAYSRLSQKSKTFEDQDQVNYTFSDYSSQSVWPYIVGQWGRENFWQMRFGYRLVKFRGTATTDVSPGPGRPVEADIHMLSGALEKVWSIGPVFLGPCVEFDHATGITLKLGGREFPTTAEDLPNYFGIGALVGAQKFLNEKVSIYGEIRVMEFLSQQPIVNLEAAGGAVYWF